MARKQRIENEEHFSHSIMVNNLAEEKSCSIADIMHTKFIVFWAVVVSSILSCSSPIQKLPAEITENPLKHDLETIVVMGINDFHGSLTTEFARTREAEGVETVQYERGGAAILAKHVSILRSQFGDRFLLLDAGDEFQGSIESNMEQGAPVVQFFNAIGVNAATIGNHEFDFGALMGSVAQDKDKRGALKARLGEAHYPYVSANIIERATKRMPEFPNTYPHILLAAGRIKVGIIGLATLETPRATRYENVSDLEFTDPVKSTLHEAAALRKAGANIVLLLAHAGLKCKPGRVSAASSFRKASDPQGECDQNGEIVKLLSTLPSGTVDAVISGHTHQIIHHWVNDLPVIQAGAYNQYYNLLYLTYDWTQGKLLSDRNRIEGPVSVCPLVFANQGDCNGDRPAQKNGGRGELVTPKFHGREIKPDQAVTELLEPTFRKTAFEKSRILAQAVRPIQHTRTGESEMGNLLSDAIREKVKADVALINPGGIRANFESGNITFGALFRVIPFDNSIAVLTVTGKELRMILRVAQNGAKGYFPVSGVQLRLRHLDALAPADDLNRNGKIEPWEVNRLLEVKVVDASGTSRPLKDSDTYRLATIDFLVSGGDDLGWVMNQVPRERIDLSSGGVIRDVVMEYLVRSGPLNDPAHPLVNPQKPRFKIESARLKSTRHRVTKGKKAKK